MKIHRLEPAVGKLDSAKRGSGRTCVLAIERHLRRTDTLAGSCGASTSEDENDDSFDISDQVEQVEGIDADGRHWSRPSNVPRIGQEEQVTTLKTALNVIESLDKTTSLLRAALAQQETEAAAAKKALLLSRAERTALQKQLEKANSDYVELLQKAGDLNTALNEREEAIASTREHVATLEAQLAAEAKDATKLAKAIEEAKKRYCDELDKRCAQFHVQIGDLSITLATRDEQINKLNAANAKLAERCDELTKNINVIESGKEATREKLKSQTGSIMFLEAVLLAERKAAEQKIAELIVDLERERSERSIVESQSATIRKEIILLLPKLAVTAKSIQ